MPDAWYEEVDASTRLTQGDIILNCPLVTWNPQPLQPDVGDAAPLLAFLFTTHRGHCEYFSSALAIMARSVGIPARNVTGFVGGQYNPYGDYYALRQGDAHSWVELHLDQVGWVTFDPTPTSRSAFGPPDGVLATAQAMLDAARNRWNNSVVGYDLHTQAELMRRMAAWLARWHQTEKPAAAVRAPTHHGWRAARQLWVVPLGLVLLGVGLWLRHKRRRSAPASRLAAHQEQALQLYRELLRTLDALGHSRAPNETAWELCDRLEQARFDHGQLVRAVTDRYMASRFGLEPLSSHDLERLRALVVALPLSKTSPQPRTHS